MKEKIFNSDNSLLAKKVEDEAIGLKGFLVIDSKVNGLSCGGLRISPTVSFQEIKDLAKAMSLKQGFVGLPRGGARAGIIADSNITEERRQQLINCFGEIIREELIDRRYLLGPDVGTFPEDINKMYAHLNIEIPKSSKTSANSGYYTSLSVLYCMEAGLRMLEKDVATSSIAIEGFGRVGQPLANQLYQLGSKVVAISNIFGGIYQPAGLNVHEFSGFIKRNSPQKIQSYPNAQPISKEALLELEVDVLSPCATDSTIHSGNANKVKAKLVCAGANNPVTFLADEILFKKDILYFPDFISNCGGVLGNAVEFAKMKEKHIHQLIKDDVIEILFQICQLSKKHEVSPHSQAVTLVEQKINKTQTSEALTFKKELLELGLKMYRKGWIPSVLTKSYAYSSIRKRLRKNIL